MNPAFGCKTGIGFLFEKKIINFKPDGISEVRIWGNWYLMQTLPLISNHLLAFNSVKTMKVKILSTNEMTSGFKSIVILFHNTNR